MRRTLVCFVIGSALSALPASSQEEALDSEADLLLAEDLPSVVTAARYEQPISEAPSSVSIVTADEIGTHGYRTLGEILANVTGFYTSDDRNYVYAGVRGFGISGDYNNRILLLVDGHRVNDAIYYGGQIDRSFPVDVGMMERVEVVRGPGSALYGTSAFFAVVNVITKRGRDLEGGEAQIDYGSDVMGGGRLTYGRRTQSGAEFVVSASGMRSDGKRRLYYPEFDDPSTSFGVARDADGEDEVDVFGSLRKGDFAVQIAWAQRDKIIPTAAFGTYFGIDDTKTRDSTGWIHAVYERELGAGWFVSGRAYFDRYYYRGNYVYDYAVAPPPFLVDNGDVAEGERVGTDFQFSGAIGSRQRVTLGAEAVYNFRLRMFNGDVNPQATYIDFDGESFDWGMFLQDEIELMEQLQLLVGVRHDHNDSFGGSTNPRAALIYEPTRGTALKILYGSAYRAPNTYELFYVGPNYVVPQNLQPETIDTAELVWEQSLFRGVRVVASAYYSKIDDLIELTTTPLGELQFDNQGRVKAYGGEATVEATIGRGWKARVGLVTQRAEDASGARLQNSPRSIATFAFSTPLVLERFKVAFDGRYLGERETGRAKDATGSFVPNLTLHARELFGRVDLSLTAKNLFDQRYYDPSSDEHVQDRIEQNGLTFVATATVKF